MAGAEDRLLEMLLRLVWPATSAEAVKRSIVNDLTELQAVRPDNLTDEEYADWRRTLLDGLGDNRHPEPVFMATAGILGVVIGAGCGYALWVGANDWAFGTAIGAVAAGVLFLRCWRGLAAKRGLTRADREAVVAELLDRNLVTADEAAQLRDRIAQLLPADRL